LLDLLSERLRFSSSMSSLDCADALVSSDVAGVVVDLCWDVEEDDADAAGAAASSPGRGGSGFCIDKSISDALTVASEYALASIDARRRPVTLDDAIEKKFLATVNGVGETDCGTGDADLDVDECGWGKKDAGLSRSASLGTGDSCAEAVAPLPPIRLNTREKVCLSGSTENIVSSPGIDDAGESSSAMAAAVAVLLALGVGGWWRGAGCACSSSVAADGLLSLKEEDHEGAAG